MKLHTNYHTHLALCGHAIGTAEDYVVEAIKQHFTVLGISDHGPIPRSFMTKQEYLAFGLDLQMTESDFYNIYLPDCLETKQKYKDQIKVYLGVEIEYIPGKEEYFKKLLNDLDYLALGVHYFPYNGGMYNVYDSMNKAQVLEYAKTVSDALDSGLYKFITHPDIYLMNYTENNIHLFDEIAIQAARIIIEAAIRNNVYLEVNGAGFRRGFFIQENRVKYLYPRYDFWKIVEEYPQVKVIFGADSHEPSSLNDDVIQKAYEFANSFQFQLVSEIDL